MHHRSNAGKGSAKFFHNTSKPHPLNTMSVAMGQVTLTRGGICL